MGTIRLITTSGTVTILLTLTITFSTYFALGISYIALHYAISTKSSSEFQVFFGGARLYFTTILVCGTSYCLNIIELTYSSLWGTDLKSRLMSLIKEKGELNNIDVLPEDLRKHVRSYQGELTQTQKKEVEMIVFNTECEHLNKM